MIFGLVILSFLSSCTNDDGPDTSSLPLLVEKIQEYNELSLFAEAIELSGIATQIDEGFFTVFAPNNLAFQEFFSANGISSLSEIPQQELADIIFYHTVVGIAKRSEIVSNYYASGCFCSPENTAVTILIEVGNQVFILNNRANVVFADQEARNGMIHFVDKVLTPPSVNDLMVQNTTFSDLRIAFNNSGLLDTLESGSNFTLLVPPNEAINIFLDELGKASLTSLSLDSLDMLARSHIANGNLNIQDMLNRDIQSLEPAVKWTLLEELDRLSVNDSISVLLADLQATNGIIQIIDRPLFPK